MDKFFKLKENGTNVTTEFLAGLTTFFAMSYIIFVNPNILSKTGNAIPSSLLINDYCNSCQYISDGSFRKRSLRISTRDGVKRVLYIYSCIRPWIYLARSISNGIHLWFIQYFYYCNKSSEDDY